MGARKKGKGAEFDTLGAIAKVRAALKPQKTAMVAADTPADAEAKAKARTYASQVATQPAANAEQILRLYGADVHGALDPQETFNRIADRARDDDRALKYAKYMLVAQAHALDTLFTNLALTERGENWQPAGTYLKLALRAQSQCRATLETLGEPIRPPVVLAHQANIAQGHQQVNNGDAVPVARGEIQNGQNKVLGNDDGKGEWLDAGAARATAPGDKAVATVATLHRTQDGRREGHGG